MEWRVSVVERKQITRISLEWNRLERFTTSFDVGKDMGIFRHKHYKAIVESPSIKEALVFIEDGLFSWSRWMSNLLMTGTRFVRSILNSPLGLFRSVPYHRLHLTSSIQAWSNIVQQINRICQRLTRLCALRPSAQTCNCESLALRWVACSRGYFENI